MFKLYMPADSLLLAADELDERLGYTAGAECVAIGDIDKLDRGDAGEVEG